MKTQLIFSLPEDRYDLHMAQRGSDYLFALQDFADRLREGIKYHDKQWEEIHGLFYAVMDEYSINMYEEVM